ncbi:CMP-N-acetylneuraminate-beta-galactosamide-alpha-2,3-sialyltransferase 4-like [Oryzias latipes]|uniref:CMP-N-acetylneuraminate-beta-galactosamide- alpha-2,3-sialyltransferase 4-like n=1 Tax=Oryzias latipes TaxID=8090 RepID=UPI000CE2091A|nr:CMP-N-acetylneuraminate-beta-galactosamide-alpha-2,3-sialyltransferase 4-like [Oryzias latipes]
MDTSTAKDIFCSVVAALDRVGVDWSRAVSLATDGAPSMIGKKAGVMTKFREKVIVFRPLCLKVKKYSPIVICYSVAHRLNDAPVRGFEKDVGNKTTMRIFYPESATYNPGLHNEEDTLMVLVPFKTNDLRWLKEILYDEKRVRNKREYSIIISTCLNFFWTRSQPGGKVFTTFSLYNLGILHEPAVLCCFLQKNFHPTTGFLAVFVALNYCDVVHLAGFGYPPKRDQQHPIHYFDHNTMKAMMKSPHDISHEARVLKKLEDLGVLKYLHPHL